MVFKVIVSVDLIKQKLLKIIFFLFEFLVQYHALFQVFYITVIEVNAMVTRTVFRHKGNTLQVSYAINEVIRYK